MNLSLTKTGERLLCAFCKNSFFSSKKRKPSTCGRPECIRGYKKVRTQAAPQVMNVESYHRMLENLKKIGMEKEWFLVFSLGETGMTLHELLELKPSDLYSDGTTHALALRPAWKKNAPRILHPISGRTAGVFQRWMIRRGIDKDAKVFPYGKRAIYGMWKKALETASLSSYDMRSLRHMYGMLVALATDDEKMVARYLRMKDLASARSYVKEARRLLKGA